MKLTQPFFRLPVRFDVARLRAEVEALPDSAWAKHPNEIEGNSSLRLVSVDGGENDDVGGRMQPTAHLRQCPYIRQVLSSFGVVWSRSRLMRLNPHSVVPEHADINYHWFYRVRMHIPVITRPEVQFHCDGQVVHMAPGEAWLFDNWRRHRVENATDDTRIHLVADTSGTAAFWEFVAQSGAGRLRGQNTRLSPRHRSDAAHRACAAAPRDAAGRGGAVSDRFAWRAGAQSKFSRRPGRSSPVTTGCFSRSASTGVSCMRCAARAQSAGLSTVIFSKSCALLRRRSPMGSSCVRTASRRTRFSKADCCGNCCKTRQPPDSSQSPNRKPCRAMSSASRSATRSLNSSSYISV